MDSISSHTFSLRTAPSCKSISSQHKHSTQNRQQYQFSTLFSFTSSGNMSGKKLSKFNPFSRLSSSARKSASAQKVGAAEGFSLSRALSSRSSSGNTGCGSKGVPTNSFVDQAPPAYEEFASHGAAVEDSPSQQTDESDFDLLREYDTVFLIDDSGSMYGSRWRETREALKVMVPICVALDDDGVDIHFMNKRSSTPADSIKGAPRGGFRNITSAEAVHRIFDTVSPSGGTPTGKRLDDILKAYLQRYEQDQGIKMINIIVITDGQPPDDHNPEGPIIKAAAKLDSLDAFPTQVGIQFFQVGTDAKAAKALKYLDNNLKDLNGVRDMVDTVQYGKNSLDGNGILKTVLGGINTRLDAVELSKQYPGHGRFP
ncbi:hypothetical protein F5Y15DRAFT_368143 [Xylariaceae sp. FL0016]|nr:hypothetical protein F5Y15DRAFT_368143 [Xylariaceae sp. FL0016]